MTYEGEALPGIRIVPVGEHGWSDDYSYMRQVTCMNHPSALYFTKDVFHRTVFLIHPPEGYGGECECPVSAMGVWVDENGSDRTKGTKFHAATHPDYPDLRPPDESNA